MVGSLALNQADLGSTPSPPAMPRSTTGQVTCLSSRTGWVRFPYAVLCTSRWRSVVGLTYSPVTGEIASSNLVVTAGPSRAEDGQPSDGSPGSDTRHR